MSDQIFIGFVEDYEKFQEENGANASGALEDKEIRKIAYDNMDPISDEDLKILRGTITRHEYDTVYMQSRMDFYDDYYHEDPDSYEALLSEVKKIRRIYVNYNDFLRALDLREQYIDSLVEKYGGSGLFEVYYNTGLVTDWIPPEPQLSKRSKDYDRYMNGDLWSADGEFDYDRFRELIDQQIEDMGIDLEKVGVRGDVVTSPVILAHLNYSSNVTDGYRSTNNINGVSVTDLTALQEMFRQWYHEESETTNSSKSEEEWFSNTPEAIRARYYTRPLVYMDNKFGEPIIDEEPDPNEMIIDSELNRPMTRSEHDQRKFVRLLRDSGWGELRMMRYLGVGSKYEQKLMFMKQKNKRKAKKKAQGLIQSIMGDDMDDLSMVISSDELRGVLFDD
jgi:hypothetical protein